MTTNTNAALRTIADWPITDPANMDAVNMAAVARAALTTTAAVPPEGWVMVPEEPDERMERAIAAAFFGTVHEARKAWVAGIAAAPKAEPALVGEQDEPREDASYESMNLAVMVLSDCGHSSNYKPLLERVAGRIDRHVERLLTAQREDLTTRAQAAPAVAAADVLEQIANEPPINGNNLAAVRVMLAAQMLRDQITEAAAAPQPAVQQGTDIGPLGQRTILDAIRSAYDLGYSDARNARTHPGDSAPGYKGRDVEKDHGGALIAKLNALAARPHPAAPVAQVDAEDAARLDWLLLSISGAEFRRIGVCYSGNASRADVDAARAAKEGESNG